MLQASFLPLAPSSDAADQLRHGLEANVDAGTEALSSALSICASLFCRQVEGAAHGRRRRSPAVQGLAQLRLRLRVQLAKAGGRTARPCALPGWRRPGRPAPCGRSRTPPSAPGGRSPRSTVGQSFRSASCRLARIASAAARASSSRRWRSAIGRGHCLAQQLRALLVELLVLALELARAPFGLGLARRGGRQFAGDPLLARVDRIAGSAGTGSASSARPGSGS